jgi:hypothetical protein
MNPSAAHSTPNVSPVSVAQRSTKIGNFESSNGDGLSLVGLGVISLIMSFIFLFLIAYGVIWLILFLLTLFCGITNIAFGLKKNKRHANVTCPYCLHDGKLPDGQPRYSCPICEKTSVLKDGYLFTID